MYSFLISILATISVISFNIRVGGAPDGENAWDNRKPATIAMIQDQKPDFLTIQEGMEFQMTYIARNCPEYVALGIAQDINGTKGEHMTMFYRKDSYECLEWGTFWLSETPDKPSTGWDGAYPRTATWAKMKRNGSGEVFYIINTHLDHIGVEARRKGIELIISRMAELNGNSLPVILTGDFNCTVDSEELQALVNSMNNSREKAERTDRIKSYNNWGDSGQSTIDFIWYSGFSRCVSFETITKSYAGKPFISDHFPIKSVLEF